MLKTSVCVGVATLLSLTFAGAAQAAPPTEGEATARQGVVRCGGDHFLRVGGTEIQATRYVLQNFDSTNPIIIERMRFFDASGVILADSAVLGLPLSENGILGPANNTLGPDQSAHFQIENILPFLSQNQRPIQLEIVWSSARAALTLDVSFTRVTRRRDTAGNVFEEGRSDRDCRSIFLKK